MFFVPLLQDMENLFPTCKDSKGKYITVVRRPGAHTRPNAHPQTWENLNFFPSLFNVRVKAHPPNF